MVKFQQAEANLPKIKQITAAGKELFWKFGIKRVSVEEICKEAQVSKVTFYKYFDNKTDLAIYMLSNSYQETLQVYRDLMKSDRPFEEKVRETIRMKMEGTEGVSDELVKDILEGADEEIKEFYSRISAEILKEVVDGYAEAQKQGEIRQDIKVEFMLYFMGHMMEMAADPRLQGLYGSSRELIMEVLNFFFYGIMPRNNSKK